MINERFGQRKSPQDGRRLLPDELYWFFAVAVAAAETPQSHQGESKSIQLSLTRNLIADHSLMHALPPFSTPASTSPTAISFSVPHPDRCICSIGTASFCSWYRTSMERSPASAYRQIANMWLLQRNVRSSVFMPWICPRRPRRRWSLRTWTSRCRLHASTGRRTRSSFTMVTLADKSASCCSPRSSDTVCCSTWQCIRCSTWTLRSSKSMILSTCCWCPIAPSAFCATLSTRITNKCVCALVAKPIWSHTIDKLLPHVIFFRLVTVRGMEPLAPAFSSRRRSLCSHLVSTAPDQAVACGRWTLRARWYRRTSSRRP